MNGLATFPWNVLCPLEQYLRIPVAISRFSFVLKAPIPNLLRVIHHLVCEQDWL